MFVIIKMMYCMCYFIILHFDKNYKQVHNGSGKIALVHMRYTLSDIPIPTLASEY